MCGIKRHVMLFQAALMWWPNQNGRLTLHMQARCYHGLKGVQIMFSFSLNDFGWLISSCPRVFFVNPCIQLWSFPKSHISHLMVSHVTINVSTLSPQMWLDSNIWFTISYMSKHCYRWGKSLQTAHSIFGSALRLDTPIAFCPISLFIHPLSLSVRSSFLLCVQTR